MTAFQQNADGVLVLACHNGNCHSEKGSRLADSRVRYLKTMMEQMGFEPRRLMIQTLAANMGIEFVQIVNAFEERLKALGPSRLKASASAKTGP
jgi:coenzyme F420-reducing hydrogenase delta subunit